MTDNKEEPEDLDSDDLDQDDLDQDDLESDDLEQDDLDPDDLDPEAEPSAEDLEGLEELDDEDLEDIDEEAEADDEDEEFLDIKAADGEEEDEDDDEEEAAPTPLDISGFDDHEDEDADDAEAGEAGMEEELEEDLAALLDERLAEEDSEAQESSNGQGSESEMSCEICFLLVTASQFGSPKDPRCPSDELDCPLLERVRV